MKKLNKKSFLALLMAVALFAATAVPAMAAGSDPAVTYDAAVHAFTVENAVPYVDSHNHTAADLFRDLKNAMPGDTLTQTITVAVRGITGSKVHLMLRAESENEDYQTLAEAATIAVGSDGKAVALASGLDLGTYEKDSAVTTMTVTLQLPADAGNDLQALCAEIDWVFTAEEIPIPTTEASKPATTTHPKTGDSAQIAPLLILMVLAVGVASLLLGKKRRRKESE